MYMGQANQTGLELFLWFRTVALCNPEIGLLYYNNLEKKSVVCV